MNALAMSIAWEQVRSWQTFLTAPEAAALIGMSKRATWRRIAERLAKIWLELTAERLMKEAA